jgi:HD superfamily phosphohydrolase
MDPESEVHRLLISHDKLLPERVTDLFDPKVNRTFLNDLLSSQLDADRLDYLLRDNHMTGSRYGDFDLNWLVHAFTVDPKTNRLAVVAKGVSAVEAYLQSRYHMYRNVYFHKVVRSAEGMVKLALQRARRLAVQDRLEGPARESTVYKALLGQRFSIAEFRDLDDVSVMYCFKVWSGSSDATLSSLCRGLLFRKPYKTIDLTHRADATVARKAAEAAAAAVTSAGGDAGYDLFYDEPTDTPYETHGPDSGEPGTGGDVNEVVVIDAAGRATPFAKMSHLSQALNRELMFRRVHVKPEFRDIAAAAIQTVIGD